ncbi:hypothetical protein [Clostridium perfringens]|uniref:hypothetical protein n=1 Tax=Clostridium perfringens TaxID=1502 RepID=UPI0024BC9C6E|nr:hypothetical protein [Clostridium perfringens]MDM0618077.1 hypothetical protein [Clostridium perfringens]
MYIYYKIKEQEIFKILSSMFLSLNEQIVFTKKIDINSDELLIRLNLKNYEKFSLIKIIEDQYLISKIFNLEINEIKFISKSRKQVENLKNNISFIKEVKLSSDEVDKYFIIDKNLIEFEYKSYVKIPYVEKSNYIYQERINILKGFIYGSLRDEVKLNQYLLKEEAIIYEEYSNLIKLIDNLKSKKISNKRILHDFNNIKRSMINEIEMNFKVKNYKDIIIKDISYNKIKLNNKFFNLSDSDLKLYEYILNLCVYKLSGINNEHEKLRVLIRNLVALKTNEELNKDLLLLRRRVVSEDFTVDIDNINNIVLKSIFVASIKYDNIKEFMTYLEEKKIKEKYIAFSFLGLLRGYFNVNGSLMGVRKYNHKILVDNIKFIEKYINNQTDNINIQRLKLNYIAYNLYEYRRNLNEENEYYRVKYNNNIIVINLKRENSTMRIFYYNRNKNISKSIKYFDQRMEKVKIFKKTFDFEKEFYFNYYFIIDNKIKALDYRYENIYCSILENIYEEVRKNGK